MSRSQPLSAQPLPRRKKEQRTDIWSNLLRQTREAQARNRAQAVLRRELIVCGGSPEDQRSFLQNISRPPPSQPLSRNQERRQQPKGELRLSNRYAYGYGHVTLFSPPPQSGTGVQVLGTEAEEVAHVDIHTIPSAETQYAETLRMILKGKRGYQGGEQADDEMLGNEEADSGDTRRPGVCLLLSWKEPWKFLLQLRNWLQLFAEALLPPETVPTDPMDVIKEAELALTVVVQHTEAQETLLREGYKEEDFDYVSQCLRTAILPLHPRSALVYLNTNGPPQQPGSPLGETQKVVFTALGLDLAALSPKTSRIGDNTVKVDLAPKHEFMDRMAIVIPAGWDSVAFIRTLSETFAPEQMLSTWLVDVQPVVKPPPPPSTQPTETKTDQQSRGHLANLSVAEVFESSPVDESVDESLLDSLDSPANTRPSAVQAFETKIQDPHAHKAAKPPQIEVTTKPDQKFLAEMREHLQELEAQDRDRDSSRVASGVSNTSLSSGRAVGLPTGEQTGALTDLGDVSFNVGGVSYDTISAEAAIERLKRPQPPNGRFEDPTSPTGGMTPRNLTPKPLRTARERDGSHEKSTPTATTLGAKDVASSASKMSSASKDLPIDKLEEYFSSLMKKGQGIGSRDGTPTRTRGGE